MYTQKPTQKNLLTQESKKPTYLTIPEVASGIRASPGKVRNDILNGYLEASKPAGKYLIRLSDAESKYNIKLS